MKHPFSGTSFVARDEFVFRDPGYHVWCGSVVMWEGSWWLFYSRWPQRAGFDAWSTRSEIALARGLRPWGPFIPTGQSILPSGSKPKWDSSVAHNPTVCTDGDRLLLAYTGNIGRIGSTAASVRANGDSTKSPVWWQHRNSQRIGVAVASHPSGPWRSPDKPTLDVTRGGWDSLVVNNPSLLRRRDGGWLLCYKGVSEGPRPFGRAVRHGIAVASDPLGPYRKIEGIHPFDSKESAFPAEDPFLWWDREAGIYRAIFKDIEGEFTGNAPSLALFRSDDAHHWQPDEPVLLMDTTLRWEDGREEQMTRLERPQLTFDETGKPVALQVACLPAKAEAVSFSLSFPLVDANNAALNRAETPATNA